MSEQQSKGNVYLRRQGKRPKRGRMIGLMAAVVLLAALVLLVHAESEHRTMDGVRFQDQTMNVPMPATEHIAMMLYALDAPKAELTRVNGCYVLEPETEYAVIVDLSALKGLDVDYIHDLGLIYEGQLAASDSGVFTAMLIANKEGRLCPYAGGLVYKGSEALTLCPVYDADWPETLGEVSKNGFLKLRFRTTTASACLEPVEASMLTPLGTLRMVVSDIDALAEQVYASSPWSSSSPEPYGPNAWWENGLATVA